MKLGYTDIVNKQSLECGLESEMLIRTDSAGFEGALHDVVIKSACPVTVLSLARLQKRMPGPRTHIHGIGGREKGSSRSGARK
jgi:hypothetical protein